MWRWQRGASSESYRRTRPLLIHDADRNPDQFRTTWAVRDSLEICELAFPVFSVGTNPNGPTKFVPGCINHPISVGGITVSPGDLVVADADGVVVVERDKAAAMLPLAAQKAADESARIHDILQERALLPGWLDGALRTAGVLKDGEKL